MEFGFDELDESGDGPRLTTAQKSELKDKQKKDARALFFIQQGVNEALFPKVMGATTSKDTWDLLLKHYQESSKVVTVKLQSLHRDFETLLMNSTDSVQEFSVRVAGIVNQIRSLGEDLPEQKIVEKVLRSLPAHFDHIVAAIEESKDLSDYSLDELMGSLEIHEARFKRSTGSSVEQAFQSRVDEKKEGGSGGAYNKHSGRGYSNRGRGRGRPNG